jgi:hypothetical protein
VGTWWSDHPDLEGVARRGRTELEEETVSAEQDTELLRKRRRSLGDICFEWMSRGDLVAVAVAGTQFEGQLVAAVNDLIVLRTKTIDLSINTGAVNFIRSNRRSVYPASTGARDVSSFRAQLGRYEVEATPVRLVGNSGSPDVTGVIEASTDDHLLVRDTQRVEWALPRAQVAYALRVSSESP